MTRVLTPRTSVETLRKEAKRWLKALRAAEPDARRRLTAAGYAAPAEPGLRDVQHALAREYGCESWLALKAAIEELALTGSDRAERVDRLLRHGWDGDARIARRILDLYPDIARHSLFTAVTCGDLAEVERRLARDPKAATRTGGRLNWTALAYIAYGRLDTENAVSIARLLLDATADPNFQFDDGWGSPFKILTGAIWLGEQQRPSHPQAEALVDLLVAAGADPFDLQALYNIACVPGDAGWYERLWRHSEAKGLAYKWSDPAAGRPGGNLDISTLDFLLGRAAGQNHLARAEWLLAHGANPDTIEPFHHQSAHALAQMSGFLEMLALLERHGARPTELEGVQAFQAACLAGDEDKVRALLAADPTLIDDPTPLNTAAELGNARAVALLLSLGASVHKLGEDGISPLHRAAQSESVEAVDLLVAAGGNVDLQEQRWGGTPLSWAVMMGRPHIAERLAPLSRDPRTLGYMGQTERLETILREDPARANLALPDPEGPTPLFILPPDDPDRAAAVARIFLVHGADAGWRNANGRTPIDIARDQDFHEAAAMMEASMASR
ncbi:ankyrin repeat domain-containing protein [Sphingobium sp. SCG-1]|uniref:ankyrin repeat domain-containing protein n=1 Tax=Sphingobium sp. SCG-1 TaxID=2072936 RepID=UPI0016705891|nr:ankyrin repeat domain-containing protein [Sphingobium sp. SCG-1]